MDMKTALIVSIALFTLSIGGIAQAQSSTALEVSAQVSATTSDNGKGKGAEMSAGASANASATGTAHKADPEEKKGEEGRGDEMRSATATAMTAEKGGREDDDDSGQEKDKDDSPDPMKGGVHVAAGDVDGLTEDEKEAFLARVKTHAQVKSGQDLENFAKGILIKDDNVEELSSDEDSVEVRYRVPAKFLGLFETTLPIEVVAEKAQGELGGGVKVKFPWFRFLFGIPDDVSQSSLETSVGAAVIGDLDRDGVLDVALTARLYNAISNILKTKHDTAKNSIGNIR
ncbi:MAG: hypothetical protein G01um10148_975 [Parcubacteria group bacterium Gr01-1014_8]|nr:MAG: hypothetical protein G01um10148_975 [Parcubacteria group bacterium Gr01-1014_8]